MVLPWGLPSHRLEQGTNSVQDLTSTQFSLDDRSQTTEPHRLHSPVLLSKFSARRVPRRPTGWLIICWRPAKNTHPNAIATRQLSGYHANLPVLFSALSFMRLTPHTVLYVRMLVERFATRREMLGWCFDCGAPSEASSKSLDVEKLH